LREIGRQAHTDITIDDQVGGKISLDLKNVTVETALKQVCTNHALVYEYLPADKSYRIIKVGSYAGQTGESHDGGSARGEKLAPSASGPGPASKAENSHADPSKGASPARPDFGDKRFDRRGRPMYKTGELLVRFKPDVAYEQIAAFNQKFGFTSIGYIQRFRIHKIQLPEGVAEKRAIELYMASGLVEIVEKHALRYANQTPDDLFYNDQWGLPQAMAPQAWDLTTGSADVIVAVIDSGVNYLHPDLQDNIWINETEFNGQPYLDDDGNGYVDDVYGYDFTDGDADPMDVDGHGTHVAGIIGARGNDGYGVAGVCWNIKIMVLKVQADSSDDMLEGDIIEAIGYAIDQGARIVNCSFGGESDGFPSSEYDAFNDLLNEGILAVCSAGNDTLNTDTQGNENYPSCYALDNILSVAASDQNDNLAGFSNYGSVSVDLMAPGDGILSTTAHIDASVAYTIGTESFQYAALELEYAGTTNELGISGLIYACGLGEPSEFPQGVSGNIALVQRGELYFSEKVTNAMNAGASGVVIYNNVPGGFRGTLGDTDAWIPAVSISREDGDKILAHLQANGNFSVTVVNQPMDVNSYWLYMSGTSMAAPFVSGLSGLMLSLNPDIGYNAIKAAIMDTVDQVPAVANQLVTGGRVNAFNAISAVVEPFNLSCSMGVGIEDAILALQLLAGMNPAICYPYSAADIDLDGDDRIGMAEATYILHRISGLRP